MVRNKIALAFCLALLAFLSACAHTMTADELRILPASDTVGAPTLATALGLSETAQVKAGQVVGNKPLASLFQQYFDEGLELNPIGGTFLGLRKYNSRWENTLSPAHRQKVHSYNSNWLNKMNNFDRQSLNSSDLVSLQVLTYQLGQALENEQYPDYLLPISQFYSLPNFFAQLGSGKSVQPFANQEDYQNWQSRAQGIPVIFEQAISNMREGISIGVVQPAVIMEKVLPQLKAQLVEDVTDSIFWKPVANLPASITAADADKIQTDYRQLISNTIQPAYQRLYDFIKDIYLPACRQSIGWSALPNGENWYKAKIREHTTTAMSANEIHQFGLKEVERISAEMLKVKDTVGFEGDLPEFFIFLQQQDQFYFDNEADLLQGYRDLQAKINSNLPKLFNIAPKTEYEVRPIPAFQAASSAGASYTSGTPDGSRPGIFYVNTFNLKAQPKFIMETLSIHEASPGHHFQISIQQEISGLPMFRRFGGFTAFAEGWALYAESLGKEMGMFTDPYMYYGRLSDEMLRAMRLVVDTGMHAKSWSRQQAIDYMLEHSSMAKSDVVAEVERYIAIPGQALAYKVGQREIARLRHYAEQELDEAFDIRAFHTLILTGGSVPMGVLDQQVKAWVKRLKNI